MVNMRESIEEMKQTGERFRDKQEQEKKKRRKEFARFMFRNVPQVNVISFRSRPKRFWNGRRIKSLVDLRNNKNN